jgi:hypothetical protein
VDKLKTQQPDKKADKKADKVEDKKADKVEDSDRAAESPPCEVSRCQFYETPFSARKIFGQILSIISGQNGTNRRQIVMYLINMGTFNSTKGRCYDQNFQRFSTIFGEKLAFFSNTNVMIEFFSKFSFVLSQKNANFWQIFSAKIF